MLRMECSYMCVCVVSNSIIVGDLMCRDWLTYRKPGHQFLDELSLMFTTLDGSGTPLVGLWHNTLGFVLTQGVV